MYPGYNFITNPLFGGQQQMQPFGQQMSPLGQQMSPLGGAQMSPMGQQPMQQPTGQLPPMGPTLGQSFMQGGQPPAPTDPAAKLQHQQGGLGAMWPLFGLSGMLMRQNGGLGGLAPLFGMTGMLLHKAKVF